MHQCCWESRSRKKALEAEPLLSFELLLTRSLGYRSLYEMRSSMGSHEMFLWLAEYEDNPWGPERADLAAAVIAREVVNMSGKTLREGATTTAIDFMPYLQSEPQPMADDFESLSKFVQQHR